MHVKCTLLLLAAGNTAHAARPRLTPLPTFLYFFFSEEITAQTSTVASHTAPMFVLV
ncbi:hypothetical protein LDENG_00193450 [Lucifuga dentata]|nr:hypothetical protein LDENG_00193450 [Lucifuga dentata]